MSGFTTLPPAFWSSTYTSQMFDSGTYLTKRQADTLYLSIGYISVISLLEGVTPGIAQASKVLALGSSKQVTGLGQFTWNDINDAIQIVNTNTSGRANLKMTNDVSDYLEIGLRGSTASYPRTMYMYSNGDYRMLMNSANGDTRFVSSSQSTSTVTGALITDGGVGISKNCNIGGNVTITGSLTANTSITNTLFKNVNISSALTMSGGAAVYLENGITNTAALSIVNTGTNKALTLQSPSNAGVYSVINQNSTGICFQRSTGNPQLEAQCPIDFGASLASDCIINLYGGTYFIGANSNALKLCTGGTSGIKFSRGSSYAESVSLAQITNEGSLQTVAGLRASGYNTTDYAGWSGGGAEMHYAASTASFFGYNRSTLMYTACQFGPSIYTSSLGRVGIATSPSDYVLTVGYNTQNLSGGYGYLNSSGSTGTGSSTGSVNFSAYFAGRIAVLGEIDVGSDARLKENIRAVTQEEAESFFNVEPKHYTFCPETNNDEQFGYIAQDLLKAGLDDVVCCREDLQEGLPEHIDSDGFVSPANSVMSVSYPKLTALLHAYVKILEERVKNLEAKVFVPKEYSHANCPERNCDSNGDTKEDSSDSAPPKKPIRSRRRKEVVSE